jgi:NitT/TauT family transport system ATP-binding protein
MAAGSSAAPAAGAKARSSTAVSLADVSVTFRLADGGAYTAVQGCTLDVADGEFVAIVGPTGCGKSTLLNVAAGLIEPSHGNARIFGAPLPGLNRQAGYLFQAEALFPWKTAVENVAIGLEIAGTPKGDARARARCRRPLSAHAVRRPAQARRADPGADPRSEDPADG